MKVLFFLMAFLSGTSLFAMDSSSGCGVLSSMKKAASFLVVVRSNQKV